MKYSVIFEKSSYAFADYFKLNPHPADLKELMGILVAILTAQDGD